MEEKLKSIARRIHWSLLLKAAVFGLAWWLLPFWVFVLIALYLYCVPWFEPGKLAVPFLVLLVLAYGQAPGAAFAVASGAVFFLVLLLRDLLVIDRRAAHELLVLALSFLLLRDFYLAFNQGVNAASFFWALIAAAVTALLFENAFPVVFGDASVDPIKKRVAAWLSFLLIFQALLIGLFLPLDFIYQFAIVFLVIVILVDLVPEHLARGLSKNKILAATMTVSALFVIILASARWGL